MSCSGRGMAMKPTALSISPALVATVTAVAALALVPVLDGARAGGRGRAGASSEIPVVDSTLDRSVAVGEQVEVTASIRGALGLAAFEATVRFDPAVVRPTGVTMGEFLPPDSQPLGPDESEPGRLAFGSYNAGGNDASGSGILAVVTFEVLANGDPAFQLDSARSGAFDMYGVALETAVELTSGVPIYLPVLETAGG